MTEDERFGAGANSADEHQLKAQDKKVSKATRQKKEDLKALLTSRASRRLIREWMDACGVFDESYTRGDPYATAFNEGKRSVGLMLRRNVMLGGPEYLLAMDREAEEDKENS